VNLGSALIVTAMVAAGAGAAELRDDRGMVLSLQRPAGRIVTLAPHLGEIAYIAGAGTKLVGVSSYTLLPAGAERLPLVADSGHINVERVLVLRPDLVLGWRSGNAALQIARLERLGIPVFVTEVRSLRDIPRIARQIGSLAGSRDLAERHARQFESELAEIRGRYRSAQSVAVFLEIWHRPLLTVSGEHLISDAIRLCAGRNVFAGTDILTPRVSKERLLGAQPDAIVTSGYGSEAREAWRGLEGVPAVRNNRIYAVDADLLHAQGPRFLEGVRALCGRLELARK
jgi:iron complex transport system substrate-binding protein